MYLDYFLPDYNIGIECQGIQHYTDIIIRGENKYEYIKENDKLKRQLCNKHGIKIIYYTEPCLYNNYCKDKTDTFCEEKEIINYIKSYVGNNI